MRISPVLAFLAGVLSSLPGSLRAQQPPAAPVDAAAVLAALKDIKTSHAQVVAREKEQVLDSIRAAVADPIKAYEQAVMASEFQGKVDNVGMKLVEWRKQNAELLRDRAFANGLRLQLVYISLTWQRSMGVKTKDLLPLLYDYTTQAVNSYDTLGTFKMIDKSLADNVFVTYFQLGPFINALPEWEPLPFNVDGIFQKTILPELRKEKDPRLVAYWDYKIQTEGARVEQKPNGLAINKFNSIRRPTLLWNRAEDELVLGDTSHAVADMLALIRGHPDHPDFDTWTARLTGIVSPKPDAPGVSPTPAH